MIVEQLISDPRRPGSTRIVVRGRAAWTVPADVVAALGLVAGRPVPGEAVARLEAAADEEGAVRAGMRALERRAHSSAELIRKLERKGHGRQAAEAAAARLLRLGLLDDLAFARAFVAARSARGRGPVRLRHDLQQLGVDAATAALALTELTADMTDPLEQPRALAQKRARQLAGLPADARRRRLLAFLARRGFRGADARQIVERVVSA